MKKNNSFLFHVRGLKGALTILLSDTILILLINGALFKFSPSNLDYAAFIPQKFIVALLFTLVVCLISLAINRLYFIDESLSLLILVKKLCLSFSITCLSVFTFGYFSSQFREIQTVLFPFPSLMITFVCLFLFRYLLFFDFYQNRARIIILGVNELSRKILEESQKKRFKAYEIIGMASTNPHIVNTLFSGAPVLGLIEDLSDIVKSYNPDCIVVALRNRRGRLPVRSLLQIKASGVRILESTSFYERITNKIMVDEFLKPSWFIFEEGFNSSQLYRSIKRVQGLIISIILLFILSPILACIALCIKIDSPGPIVYCQKRVGLNGRIFELYKFRSMFHQREEKQPAMYTEKNDPRITRVGKLIRKIRLDEVLQLFNVLKGDMDIVGPRPEQPDFVDYLQSRIPYYNLRHTLRPGITGWAQVRYRYGDSLRAAQKKLHHDLFYVKNYSWTLDILIIILTFREILALKGR